MTDEFDAEILQLIPNRTIEKLREEGIFTQVTRAADGTDGVLVMEGLLVVESDQPVVAVTVRQNDDPEKEFPQEVPILTTFPVLPGSPD